MTALLSCFLYTSRLASDCPPTIVGGLVKRAREVNAIHGITGLLVFDGERFAQYFEGPPKEVNKLISKLFDDQRHVDFKEILAIEDLPERRYPSWSMGYSDIAIDGLDIDLMSLTDGNTALAFFNKAASSIDRM